MSQLWVIGYDYDCVHVHVHVLGTVSVIYNNNPTNPTVKEDYADNIQTQSDTSNGEHHLGVVDIYMHRQLMIKGDQHPIWTIALTLQGNKSLNGLQKYTNTQP